MPVSSSNSASISSVIRSSDGLSRRQSMYVAEVVAEQDAAIALRAAPSSPRAQAGVEAVADRLLVGLGDAEQHPDRAHRHLGAEVGDEVEAACAHERVEAGRAEGSRTLSSSAFMRRGVNTRDRRPRCTSWTGGSSMRMIPGGISMSALMMLERSSPWPDR